MSYPILKYPRTPHLEGSRLQAGDEDLSQVPFSHLKGKYLVIEEKVDDKEIAKEENIKYNEEELKCVVKYALDKYKDNIIGTQRSNNIFIKNLFTK